MNSNNTSSSSRSAGGQGALLFPAANNDRGRSSIPPIGAGPGAGQGISSAVGSKSSWTAWREPPTAQAYEILEGDCIHKQRSPDLKFIDPPNKNIASETCPICFADGLRYALFQLAPRPGVILPSIMKRVTSSFEAGKRYGHSIKVQVSVSANARGFQKSAWVEGPALYGRENKFHLWKGDKSSYIDTGKVLLFKVKKGMNGETYHGLIAALLTNHEVHPSKFMNCSILLDLTGGSENQKSFIRYFLPDFQIRERSALPLPKGSSVKSRPMATKFIAKFFQNNSQKNHANVFAAIRSYLNDKLIADCTSCSYTTPAKIAALYIDAYLEATQQIRLPCQKEAGTVVVIYVRTGHTAPDKRFMTRPNLLICLKSAKEAYNGSQGTIILMGDIGFEELSELRNDIVLPSNLNLLCVSSPFYLLPKAPVNADAQKVWSLFEAAGDYMPIELKYLGIYLALQQLYGERLAVIGWRSGTLDGAAFLGIPVYSLDDIPSRDECMISKKDNTFLNGQYLHKLSHYHEDGSSIEYYKRYYDRRKYEEFETEQLKKMPDGPEKEVALRSALEKAAIKSFRPERMEELAITLDNFILINVTVNNSKAAPKKSYFDLSEYNKTAGNHLMAALKVYLMSDLDGRPLWTQRLTLMRKESGELGRAEATVATDSLTSRFEKAGLVPYV